MTTNNSYSISPTWQNDALQTMHGVMPNQTNNALDPQFNAWLGYRDILLRSTNSGALFSNMVVSTYSLIYTTGGYQGGVLSANGAIHMMQGNAPVGQKISASGVVSTYSLVYTTSNGYVGGVLASNGDIHMIPSNASVGQKISTLSCVPFEDGVCLSSFLNKF